MVRAYGSLTNEMVVRDMAVAYSSYQEVVNEIVAIPQYLSGGRGLIHSLSAELEIECVLSALQN